jgi:hypothetical protein
VAPHVDVQGECPLSWPVGWKRTQAYERTAWTNASRMGTALCRDRLIRELGHLRAEDVVLSTNQAVRLDGLPRASAGEPSDPGVAVSFILRGRQTVLACDRYDSLAGNYRALARHVEALRGMERWGVGTLEQAFAGYAALPPIGGTTIVWSEVLGVRPDAPLAEVRAAYSRLIKAAHPDYGGTVERLALVQSAWEAARAREEVA